MVAQELARFIQFKDGRLSRRDDGTWRVKEGAFIPALNKALSPPRLETSTFRADGLAEPELWELGVRELEANGSLPIKAAAMISPSLVLAEDLQLEQDPPPSRHVNILGWSDEKAANKAKAQQLAEQARAVIRPGSGL